MIGTTHVDALALFEADPKTEAVVMIGEIGVTAEETAARVVQIGRRFQDADLIAQGLNCHGRIMIYSGRVREGLALLDEALVGVSAGEVSPIIAGNVYCSMIEACQ